MAQDDVFYQRYFGMKEYEAIEYLKQHTGDNQHGKYLREAVQLLVKAESQSMELPATALGQVCTAIASAQLAKKFGIGIDITDRFIAAATLKKEELQDRLESASRKSA